MSTLLTILSFPFWFVGLFLLMVALFGKIYINGVDMNYTRPLGDRVMVRFLFFIVSLIPLGIAYLMVF
jgi:hypothetical protein